MSTSWTSDWSNMSTRGLEKRQVWSQRCIIRGLSDWRSNQSYNRGRQKVRSNMSTRGRQTGAICLLVRRQTGAICLPVDVRLEQYVYPWTSDWSNMSTRGRQTGAICLPVDVRLEQYVYPWTSDWSNMSTRGRQTGAICLPVDVRLEQYVYS